MILLVNFDLTNVQLETPNGQTLIQRAAKIQLALKTEAPLKTVLVI